MSKCKYKKDCLHFRKESFTCVYRKEGSDYCGQYKILEQEAIREKNRKKDKDRMEPFEEATEFRRLETGEQYMVKNILKPALIELFELKED